MAKYHDPERFFDNPEQAELYPYPVLGRWEHLTALENSVDSDPNRDNIGLEMPHAHLAAATAQAETMGAEADAGEGYRWEVDTDTAPYVVIAMRRVPVVPEVEYPEVKPGLGQFFGVRDYVGNEEPWGYGFQGFHVHRWPERVVAAAAVEGALDPAEATPLSDDEIAQTTGSNVFDGTKALEAAIAAGTAVVPLAAGESLGLGNHDTGVPAAVPGRSPMAERHLDLTGAEANSAETEDGREDDDAELTRAGIVGTGLAAAAAEENVHPTLGQLDADGYPLNRLKPARPQIRAARMPEGGRFWRRLAALTAITGIAVAAVVATIAHRGHDAPKTDGEAAIHFLPDYKTPLNPDTNNSGQVETQQPVDPMAYQTGGNLWTEAVAHFGKKNATPELQKMVAAAERRGVHVEVVQLRGGKFSIESVTLQDGTVLKANKDKWDELVKAQRADAIAAASARTVARFQAEKALVDKLMAGLANQAAATAKATKA